MNSTLERLTKDFTQLIGPEAFAKAEAAIAAAKAAEAAAAAAKAKAAAEAAAKAAAAAAAAPAAPSGTAAAPAPATPKPAVAGPAAKPAVAVSAAPTTVAAPASGTPAASAPATPAPKPAAPAAPRPATPAAAGATSATPAAAAPRPAPAAPPAPPPPSLPLQTTTHAAKGFDFDAIVAPADVINAAQILDREGFAIDAVTGIDWMAQNEMEVVYDYFHPTQQLRAVVRTRVPRATPELPTISHVFPGANWHERETHDFFGIRFTGHPNLKPFLLPEDADFHPLRKDYQP